MVHRTGASRPARPWDRSTFAVRKQVPTASSYYWFRPCSYGPELDSGSMPPPHAPRSSTNLLHDLGSSPTGDETLHSLRRNNIWGDGKTGTRWTKPVAIEGRQPFGRFHRSELDQRQSCPRWTAR